MKIKGKKIEGPNTEILVIPRGNGESIVLTFQAILSYEEFNLLCPQPLPPTKVLRNGAKVADLEDKMYSQQCNDYSHRRFAWMVLESLKATPELEWETVNFNDPDTWGNYSKELKDSGFSDTEQQLIVTKMMEVNCLNEKRLDEARERFLASREAIPNGSFSHKDVQQIMVSGEPAKE